MTCDSYRNGGMCGSSHLEFPEDCLSSTFLPPGTKSSERTLSPLWLMGNYSFFSNRNLVVVVVGGINLLTTQHHLQVLSGAPSRKACGLASPHTNVRIKGDRNEDFSSQYWEGSCSHLLNHNTRKQRTINNMKRKSTCHLCAYLFNNNKKSPASLSSLLPLPIS